MIRIELKGIETVYPDALYDDVLLNNLNHEEP
jgi:hypothetical protein